MISSSQVRYNAVLGSVLTGAFAKKKFLGGLVQRQLFYFLGLGILHTFGCAVKSEMSRPDTLSPM